jgi:CHRD domain
MQHKSRRIAIAALACGAAIAPFAGGLSPATASSGDAVANLQPVALNSVDGSGIAFVSVHGTRVDVTMRANGLLADAPHAAHIHFGAQARHECPNAGDDSDGSGTLNTSEGGPAYGPVRVSLTKTGDTSPASALAVDRFDTAPGGNLSYQRGHIKVAQDVAKAITRGEAVIVIHGVDHNHDGAYDGTTPSDLDPSLPTEATDPALCGRVVPQN